NASAGCNGFVCHIGEQALNNRAAAITKYRFIYPAVAWFPEALCCSRPTSPPAPNIFLLHAFYFASKELRQGARQTRLQPESQPLHASNTLLFPNRPSGNKPSP